MSTTHATGASVAAGRLPCSVILSVRAANSRQWCLAGLLPTALACVERDCCCTNCSWRWLDAVGLAATATWLEVRRASDACNWRAVVGVGGGSDSRFCTSSGLGPGLSWKPCACLKIPEQNLPSSESVWGFKLRTETEGEPRARQRSGAWAAGSTPCQEGAWAPGDR